ncbi:MAG: hypothetical protein COB14_03565 [Alphaproteobacteria bacterium]|nr:MAG: hypothetical protein COB14_03565 [Alphaproteobacteria bacterium]
MKLDIKEIPRKFNVGVDQSITISDMGQVDLDTNEQLTFITPQGAETDIVRKEWGFYATGSLNGRLPEHNLRVALTVNKQNRYYIMLVEHGFEEAFETYINEEDNALICWLDDKSLKKIQNIFAED